MKNEQDTEIFPVYSSPTNEIKHVLFGGRDAANPAGKDAGAPLEKMIENFNSEK